MDEFIDPMSERLAAYCEVYGRTPLERLGFGKDGTVWATTAGTVIKVFERALGYEREKQVYRRLAASGVRTINGCAVPVLRDTNDALGVLEMSMVSPPFVLDFASAEFGTRTEFPEEVIQEWWERKRREFGAHWPAVVGVLRALEKLGIYMTDVHPGNIRFPGMTRSAESSGSDGSGSS